MEHLAQRGFTLGRVIGQGLSGNVRRAEQESLRRPVAIKFFDNPISLADSALRKRFVREARILARVQHPFVPAVLTKGEIVTADGHIPYIIMEMIDGETLRQVLTSKKRLELPAAVRLVRQVLEALDAAHRVGAVHRDVKPENILVNRDSYAYLIDFSIGALIPGGPGVTRATQTGQGLGTMMPEQARDASRADARSDLGSAGIVLYELVVGAPLRPRLIEEDLERLPSLPLREVLRKACAVEPRSRYESAGAFSRALQRFDGRAAYAELKVALCTNVRCPGADLTERGYYRGPRVLEVPAGPFCGACGKELLFPCVNCGRPFSGDRFCAGCGTELYSLPTCDKCGSWLKPKDMGKDTAEAGCSRCVEEVATTSAESFDLFDSEDDIPF